MSFVLLGVVQTSQDSFNDEGSQSSTWIYHVGETDQVSRSPSRTLGWRRMRALRKEVPRKLWQTAVRRHDAAVPDNVGVKDNVATAAVTG